MHASPIQPLPDQSTCSMACVCHVAYTTLRTLCGGYFHTAVVVAGCDKTDRREESSALPDHPPSQCPNPQPASGMEIGKVLMQHRNRNRSTHTLLCKVSDKEPIMIV